SFNTSEFVATSRRSSQLLLDKCGLTSVSLVADWKTLDSIRKNPQDTELSIESSGPGKGNSCRCRAISTFCGEVSMRLIRFKQARAVNCWASICCCVALLSFCVQAVSQIAGTGSILGTIQDPSGAVIPNASVTLTNTSTGMTRA